jgi:predicted alpha/beta superfamily hydrolase
MHSNPAPVFAVILWIATGWCAPSILRAQQPSPAATNAKATYIEEKLHSSILDEDRRVLVRLPRRYLLDASARYPVLFKLDGGDGLKRYDDSIDVLSYADLIPDIIVVAIPNARGQRNRDMTPSSLHQEFDPMGKIGSGEMGRGDRFLDFLEKELIPHVEQRYRTDSPRILAGHSRSALLVVQSLLSEPDLFQARFVFSAPLLRDERRLIDDTATFLAKNPGHGSFIYFNWGENENEGMAQSHIAMKQLLRERAPQTLRWVIERARGANHQETPLMAIPAALHELFLGWPSTAEPGRHNRTHRTSSAQPR